MGGLETSSKLMEGGRGDRDLSTLKSENPENNELESRHQPSSKGNRTIEITYNKIHRD